MQQFSQFPQFINKRVFQSKIEIIFTGLFGILVLGTIYGPRFLKLNK